LENSNTISELKRLDTKEEIICDELHSNGPITAAAEESLTDEIIAMY
jgi:hypothetical protein